MSALDTTKRATARRVWLMNAACIVTLSYLPVAPPRAEEGSSENFALESSTLAMLGGSLSSEHYTMVVSVGESFASGSMSGGTYTADVGWLNDLDADGDGIVGALDMCPTVFAGCNDADGDGCIDLPDTDADGDGVGRGSCDCDDSNPQIWGRPAEVRNVRFTSATTITWDLPTEPGGSQPRCDLLRSPVASDFIVTGTCVESNDAGDTTAIDVAIPQAAGAFFYLVRAENDCTSGMGPLGTSQGFLARDARDCP